MVTTTWSQTAGMTSETGTDNIEDYAEQAEASKDAAAASETAAASSASAASTSASSASTDAASALSSKNAAATSETNAATSETNAASSSATASTAATNASTSASNSASSATASANSASAAATSETNAATSETNAAASETAAAGSATSASTSETNAATSATNAAASETAAATSETNAATSEANAATSETNAATSETNAATSETNAASSATAAASSASAASSSATSASNAQTAAESARDATLAAYDNFDDRYLGAKSSTPTVDNDGNALVAGSLYFDTVSGAMKVYTGSAWVAAYVSGTDYLPFSGGTMTGDIAYGDNVKATFGASADLQVYHNSFHSIIADVGSGDLLLRGANVKVQSSDGSSDLITAFPTGAVNLNYDGSSKLATSSTGVNVTGTVVADGLNVDVADGYGVNLGGGSGSFSEASYYWAQGQRASFGYDGSAVSISDKNQSGATSSKSLRVSLGGADRLLINHSTGDISFYEDTGTTAKFFWDASAERLGIGTTSPATKLDVAGDAAITNSGHFLVGKTSRDSTNTVGAELKDTGEVMATVNDSVASYLNRKTSHGDIVQFRKDNIAVGGIGSTSGGLYVDFGNWTITESGGSLYFATGGTNKMKLDASGNLDVVGSVNSNATIS